MSKIFKKILRFIGLTLKRAAIFLYRKRFIILKIFVAAIILAVVAIALWVSSFYFDFGKKDDSSAQVQKDNKVVTDVTGLYPIKVVDVIVPHTTEEIQQAVKTHTKVSIGGGRYSMGGQTASEKAVQIDMREFNKVVAFSTTTKEITVQAGITWRDIQDKIDPFNLSVMVMQTYSNFTVGGSLSVNVHGRYVGLGPVIMSVKSMKLVLADGSVVVATPEEHADLFYSVIGGMGGIAVIAEATLGLDDNVNVERTRVKMPIEEYKNYFFNNVRSSPDVIFHNGDIYPMDFDSVSAVSWIKTDKPVTTETRLIPRKEDYRFEQMAWVVMSEWPFGKWLREYVLEPFIVYGKPAVHTRNYEASYDVAELEPKDRTNSTYVLQEYFVPVEKFDEFYPKMKEVFVGNHVNILNVSIRHAKQDPGAKLAWARSESFAFVVYYKQGTDEKSKDAVKRWTKEMIDQVISVGGTYYLPYQPHATDEQFHRAYPGAIEFFEIKKKYDPSYKFTNNLWDTYYSPEKLEKFKELQEAYAAASSTGAIKPDYVRPEDNIFLTLPEWYIVYSAGEYANVLEGGMPSQFDYRKAVNEYWSEYKKVKVMASGSDHQNSNYALVLKVIGWSFTLENDVKWLYERTIGKVSELLAGNKHVEEDDFAAKVARDYEVFIYDHPWYDFPYSSYYRDLVSLQPNKTHSVGELLRRFERQVFLSMELNAKSFYSWVIRSAAHAKFGVQDDVITALIKENGAYSSVTAAHYQPFTKALLKKLEESYVTKTKLTVLEVAGNNRITFTYLDSVGAAPVASSTEIMRSSEVVSVNGGLAVSKDRITVLVPVEYIDDVYAALREKNLSIGHFYDY